MQYYIWIKRFKIGNTTFTLKDLKQVVQELVQAEEVIEKLK